MNTKLLKFAQKYYGFIYKTSPVFATYLGIHKYDHLLGDLSHEAIKKDIKKFKEFRKEAITLRGEILKQVQDDDRKSSRLGSNNNNYPSSEVKRSREEDIDYQLLKSDIELNILSLTTFRDWQKNPNIYVETPLMGIFLLVSRNALTLKQRVKAITSRINLYPKMLNQGKLNVKKPPKIYTQIALETLAGARFFLTQIPNELKSRGKISKVQARDLLTSINRALVALLEFKSYLENGLLPKSNGDFALGRKNFEKKLKFEHFLPYSAPALLKIGKEEFKRVEKELEDAARILNSGKSWMQLVEEFKNIVPQSESLIPLYKNEMASIKNFLKIKDLMTLPKEEICAVAETPSFERPTVPYAAYMPSAVFEKKQVGFFWVTPVDSKAGVVSQREQLKEHSLLSFMITTLHESYPGHHLQFCLANRNPSFTRKHGQSSLLCEGWALYCEQMMGEQGYYTDSRTKLFMLKDELWRAARVIIDVGLHCFGMTPKKALKMLVEQVKLAPAQATAEVKRYTMSPTQPMSYLVGKLLILKMRGEARKTWGEKFTLKRFHDEFLSRGTIPQPLIEKELFPG